MNKYQVFLYGLKNLLHPLNLASCDDPAYPIHGNRTPRCGSALVERFALVIVFFDFEQAI